MYTYPESYDSEATSAKTDTATIAYIREVEGDVITRAVSTVPDGFSTISPLLFYLQGSLFGISDPFNLYRFGSVGEQGLYGFDKEFGDSYTIQRIESLSNSGLEYKKYSCSVSSPVELLYAPDKVYDYIEGIGSPSEFLLLPYGGGEMSAFGWDCPELTYVTEGPENRIIFEAKGGQRIWELSGVEPVISDNQFHTPQWFTLQGIRIEEPNQPGLYIRRTATGTEKVLIK